MNSLYHPLKTSVPRPDKMNSPFSYVPHLLCVEAAEQVKKMIAKHFEWREEVEKGKMFGVLIVENETGELGFLAAFSGQICGKSDADEFVPAVFDYLDPQGYFKVHERMISEINAEVKRLSALKNNAEASEEDERQITILKKRRKRMSEDLQNWLFPNFVMINYKGERRNLVDIFDFYCHKLPPSGSGECCAPKLLQYAFLHNFKPLQIAEFWMGRSPRGEHREQGAFYPACENKCRPILRFMLGDEITEQ
jgi:tRNA pseudouridine32 synthase/23S rRNA pseudouridine746 synthase